MGGGPQDLAREVRALGAPLLFVIEGEELGVWQVRSSEPPNLIERARVDDLTALFSRNKEQWSPDAIHRAKAAAPDRGAVQLDFIDAGLLIAIEGELHGKLDTLLVENARHHAHQPPGP